MSAGHARRLAGLLPYLSQHTDEIMEIMACTILFVLVKEADHE
jgi:hypothetical protein